VAEMKLVSGGSFVLDHDARQIVAAAIQIAQRVGDRSPA